MNNLTSIAQKRSKIRFSKADLNKIEEIKEYIDNWNEPLTIPKQFDLLKPRTRDKKIQEWKENVYIWQDKNTIFFSGGAKMFLFIYGCFHNNDRQEYLKDILKSRHWQQLREFKIIEKREKQLGYTFKVGNTANGFKDFDSSEFS